MPCHYVIDKERKLILTTGEGIVTFAELKLHQDQLLADANLNATFDQLVDFATVTKVDVSVEEAKLLARRAVLSPESRRAVIATEKSVFGMFRLAQAYHEMTEGHSHLGVFYDRAEALRWLGNK
jgi:hypothetical protein